MAPSSDDDSPGTRWRRYELSSAILFEFIVALALFALFWAAMNDFVLDQFARGINETNTTLNSTDRIAKGGRWVKQFWTFMPAFALFIGATRLLARAIFESRGGVQ